MLTLAFKCLFFVSSAIKQLNLIEAKPIKGDLTKFSLIGAVYNSYDIRIVFQNFSMEKIMLSWERLIPTLHILYRNEVWDAPVSIKFEIYFAGALILTSAVMILGISYICAHVPMSLRARISVPDDWLVIKVSKSD